jgi:hypothetical protein
MAHRKIRKSATLLVPGGAGREPIIKKFLEDTMKLTAVRVCLLGLGLLFANGAKSEASALLNFQSGVTSVLCDTRVAVSATNCSAAAGFTLLGDTILFAGTIGPDWRVDTLAATTSNTPGTAVLGKINLALADVRHLSGSEDLTVDFAHDNFTAPVGADPFTSTGAAAYDVAVAGDASFLNGYARTQNDMARAPGAVATARDVVVALDGCFPLTGNTQSCAMNSPEVPFTNVGPFYSLAARTVIHQHTSLVDQVSYLEKASTTVPVVPEPATLVLVRRRRRQ